MNILGRTPINPILFYTGKISGYAAWIILILEMLKVTSISPDTPAFLRTLAYILSAMGLCITLVSAINLGKSIRLGVPIEETVLKTGGIYRFSRNPMYLAFNLFTLSAILYTAHMIILIMGIYSIAVYHLIIRGEEKFLEERFQESYRDYKKKVRRYL